MNEEEALEIFKNLILLPYDWKITDKYKGTINFIGATEGNEAIQIILNLVKKLKESCKKCIIRDELDEYINNSISVQKVKDKIEELDKKVKDYQCVENRINLYQRKVLQELLER